ncbi:soma ferritin-like [Octopus bimaculoides]|uniref:soma ferritin-like n=1 Tax=Octopus bimaculoides TaxID=37653 RepID=UPI0022E261B3|nr:soma ferritin-like [Octopus bimaculoides]
MAKTRAFLLVSILTAFFVVSTSSYSLTHTDRDNLNDQITLENQASLFYQAYGHFFESSKIALRGFGNFFMAMSLEEKEHADKLMTYMNKRLTTPEVRNIQVDAICNHLTYKCLCAIVMPATISGCSGVKIHAEDVPLLAMEDAVGLEKAVYNSLRSIVDISMDPQLQHFLEHEYLDEQVESIKQLSDYVTQLSRFNQSYVGHYMMDNRFLSESSSNIHGKH